MKYIIFLEFLFQYWSPRATVYDPIKVGSCDAQDIPPHDRAIIRALEANYQPNPENKGNPYKTIFIGRLNKKTNQETLIKVNYFDKISIKI